MQELVLTLPDGRALAYSDLGSRDGPLLVYMHGAPGSRLDLAALDAQFAARHLRVVCPDRPGYGRSSPQPRRRREQWPGDVAVLADTLEHDRFAVFGWSSGGPYTVVCAALLADRVAAATVVAGVSDVAWDGYFEDYARAWPVIVAVMQCPDETTAHALCDERFGVDGAKFAEHIPPLGADDGAWFLTRHDDAAALSASATEARRQGTIGFAQDFFIEAQPWDFDPATITGPVRVLHGETDTLVPIAHSRHTAEIIPTANLEIVPGQGHVSIFTTFPDIASELASHVTPIR